MRRLAPEDVGLITAVRNETDSRDQAAVNGWFEEERPPQIVFLAAAKVGGIAAKKKLRAEFLYDSLAIAANVIYPPTLMARKS